MNLHIGREFGIHFINFPDGQPYARLEPRCAFQLLDITWPIRNPQELFELMLIKSAADGMFAKFGTITIPYLMGARSDRRTEKGGSIPLQIVAEMLNSLNADRIRLLDVHSDAALTLIKRSDVITNERLVRHYDLPDAVLICPDAGAQKKVPDYITWNRNISNVVYCQKERDVTNGKIKLVVPQNNLWNGRNAVIVDDLCDGGATFLAIAEQVQSAKSLTLIVTHGVFSKGFDKLKQEFDEIITTNSFKDWASDALLTVIPVKEFL